MGSDIFGIKIHKWFHYDAHENYGKKDDFDECIYLTKYTNDSLEKNKQATREMFAKQRELFNQHPKFLKYIRANNKIDYKRNNIMYDILGKDDYYEIIRIASQKQLEIIGKAEFEAVLNKNSI